MGSILEFGSGTEPPKLCVYVSGDTLAVEDLAEIPRRYPRIHSGVFHLGGTRLPFGDKIPWGVTVTMDGIEGVKAVNLISPDYAIPVHFDDYGVFASPLSAFLDEMEQQGMSERIIHVPRGQSVEFPPRHDKSDTKHSAPIVIYDPDGDSHRRRFFRMVVADSRCSSLLNCPPYLVCCTCSYSGQCYMSIVTGRRRPLSPFSRSTSRGEARRDIGTSLRKSPHRTPLTRSIPKRIEDLRDGVGEANA